MYDERCLTHVTGFLTGAYKSPYDFEEGDFRRHSPRFRGEALKQKLKLVDAIK
jgi:aryl-alcohol dehydrogenase-like predicted oxidoreductase